jgi:hypothetical protein
MEKETIFGIGLGIFCLLYFAYAIWLSRKKIDVFYKIDGFYFKDKKKAKEYWEKQKARGLNDKTIATHDLESKIQIDKTNCIDFFK